MTSECDRVTTPSLLPVKSGVWRGRCGDRLGSRLRRRRRRLSFIAQYTRLRPFVIDPMAVVAHPLHLAEPPARMAVDHLPHELRQGRVVARLASER